MYHIYAQYFHPDSLLQRVREVRFYRNPRTIFKGFKVPDWATAEKTHGWEIDYYSRQAWDNAMHEFHSEATPMPFAGERQEPNPLQWFRFEQLGKGTSSRLFYNEVPEPWWHRHQGHMDPAQKDDLLYSFTYGDQEQQYDFGIDTTTEEGRAQYKAEYDAISQMVPEIIKPNELVFPHEIPRKLPEEAHFQRVWNLYRVHQMKNAIQDAVNRGQLDQADADKVNSFIHTKKFQQYVNYYALSQIGHVDAGAAVESANRVFQAIGFNVQVTQTSAEPLYRQFWRQFDQQFNLTEVDMREKLPLLIQDPAARGFAEAIVEERTQQLSA